jgi:hypothetical protein
MDSAGLYGFENPYGTYSTEDIDQIDAHDASHERKEFEILTRSTGPCRLEARFDSVI